MELDGDDLEAMSLEELANEILFRNEKLKEPGNYVNKEPGLDFLIDIADVAVVLANRILGVKSVA